MKYYIIFFVLIIVDQSSKYAVDHNMDPGESIPVFDEIMEITYIRNTGAALGIFSGRRALLLFIQLAVIILLGIIYYRYIPTNAGTRFFMILILAGAVGNFLDRLRYGYVIDFINLRFWPVFNFADMIIVIGCLGLVYFLWQDL